MLVTQSSDTTRVHRWQTCWTRSHRKLRQSDRFAHCSEHPPTIPALPDTGHWSRLTTFPGQSVCFTNSWLTLVSVRAQATRHHESETDNVTRTREEVVILRGMSRRLRLVIVSARQIFLVLALSLALRSCHGAQKSPYALHRGLSYSFAVTPLKLFIVCLIENGVPVSSSQGRLLTACTPFLSFFSFSFFVSYKGQNSLKHH